MSKVSVTAPSGKRYDYPYRKLVIMLGEEEAEKLKKYADRFHPKLSGGGNINASTRHILESVFQIASDPEVVKLVRDDPSLNDDVIMFIRKAVHEYIRMKDQELDDESFALF